MELQKIQQGAEAIIFLDKEKNIIIKDRIKKIYRISEIDEKIRKLRTRAETKLLEKASKIINCPEPFSNIRNKNLSKLKIPYISGKKLSDNLDNFSLNQQKSICNQIGKDVAKIHTSNIIHGDLTTSNMILVKSKNFPVIFFIDFGLGFISSKIEDKAVDVHLLKQALEARHFKNWEILYNKFKEGYKSTNKEQADKVLNQLIKVEKRGRYKH